MPDELDLHQDHQLPSHDPASLLDPHADFPPPDTPSQHGQPAIQPVPPNVGANLGASLPPTTLGPSSTPRKDNFSVLSRIPVDVREFRERVFRLDEPATFDAHQWDLYWPYIDNVWCLHNRMDAPTGLARGHTEKFWGGCRLQRKWDHTTSNPPPKGIRNRVRRETGTCQAKFKLTVMPNGSRVLERSTKEGHSHDIDHIDAVKRNSGVRSLVLDPFFNSWEPATIMAYLRDPEHFVDGRDMLTEAGGRFLERREIMNIFSQNLRKLYPGIDVSAIKKEQDKYKSMRTCNYKGCNRSFVDGKTLMAHRKADHPPDSRKADNNHRKYTCPTKGCHRKKKSKGFPTLLALREHQVKMEHWGSGMHHGEDGVTPCDPVNGPEDVDMDQAEAVDGAHPDETLVHSTNSGPTSASNAASAALQQVAEQEQSVSLSVPQQPLPQSLPSDHPLMPLITHGGVTGVSVVPASQDPNFMPIDPAMQETRPHHGVSAGLPPSMPDTPMSSDPEQRQAMFERYQQLQDEMTRLRGILFNP